MKPFTIELKLIQSSQSISKCDDETEEEFENRFKSSKDKYFIRCYLTCVGDDGRDKIKIFDTPDYPNGTDPWIVAWQSIYNSSLLICSEVAREIKSTKNSESEKNNDDKEQLSKFEKVIQ